MPDLVLRFNRDMLTLEGDVLIPLQAQGVPSDECVGFLDVLDAELVCDVHRYFQLAGVTCAISTTFDCSRARLAEFGLEDRLEEINVAAVRDAASCNPQHVLAAIGPCGLSLAPRGTSSFEEVFAQYFEQASALAKGNPDAILVEGMTDIADARIAALAVHYACDLPAIVSCHFAYDGHIPDSGTTPQAAAAILEGVGVAAIGLEGSDPEALIATFKELVASTSLPLLAYVDAGVPAAKPSGGMAYPLTPDQMAAWALEYRKAGCQMFGVHGGGSYAMAGAVAATISDLPVVPRQKRPADVTLATTRTAFILQSGASVDETVALVTDLSSADASQPLCLVAQTAAELERMLRDYQGRPLVDVRTLQREDTDLLLEFILLAHQYGAAVLMNVPDGQTSGELENDMMRYGLRPCDIAIEERGLLV